MPKKAVMYNVLYVPKLACNLSDAGLRMKRESCVEWDH